MARNRQTCRAPHPGARLEIQLNWRTCTWNYQLWSRRRRYISRQDSGHLETDRKGAIAEGALPRAHTPARGASRPELRDLWQQRCRGGCSGGCTSKQQRKAAELLVPAESRPCRPEPVRERATVLILFP